MRNLSDVLPCETCAKFEEDCSGRCSHEQGGSNQDAYVPKRPIHELPQELRIAISSFEEIEYSARWHAEKPQRLAERTAALFLHKAQVENAETLNLKPGSITIGMPEEYATATEQEYTGGSVSYYKVHIPNPTSGGAAYSAECNDIIEALGMNYAEGNAFKAIWRRCAARNLGKSKAGYKDGRYDAEKVVFFGQRMVEQEKAK